MSNPEKNINKSREGRGGAEKGIDARLHENAGNPEAIKRLVEQEGVDINARDNKGRTALHIAAERGYVKGAETLIEFGADVNSQNNNGETPLHRAAWLGYGEVEKTLLAKGAEPNIQDINGDTPLHYAAYYSRHDNTTTLEILVDAGADINIKNKKGETPLDLAARRNNTGAVEFLKKRSEEDLEDIDITLESPETPEKAPESEEDLRDIDNITLEPPETPKEAPAKEEMMGQRIRRIKKEFGYDKVGVFDEELGLAPASKNGECFHIDQEGRPAYEERYQHVGYFSERFATARDERGEFHIGPDGKPAYEAVYDFVEPFSNGAAVVWEKRKSFSIDVEGKEIE